MKQKTLIVGHYGSGKTEFSINLVHSLRRDGGKNVALIDLDIANPYFRSRECQSDLKSAGIAVYGNAYGYEITAEIPAIPAALRAPLEDMECTTVIDVGGNDSGARILNQFSKYFTDTETDVWCVINKNRPETADFNGAMKHIGDIERECGLSITGIVNNTHMLRKTAVQDILNGYGLCREISDAVRVPIIWNVCERRFIDEIPDEVLKEEDFRVFPIDLYMRPQWLDR